MTTSLAVWWMEHVVGYLSVDQSGDLSFIYDGDWLDRAEARPVSQSLPLRRESFSRSECRAFFEGLLPEERQREAIAQALGISEANEFKLLAELGGDVAGAISLWPEGMAPPRPSSAHVSKPLDEDELATLIENLPKRPMLAGQEGIRLSLAGAQGKLPVVLDKEGSLALPAPGQPSTHILKPPIDRFNGTTENEAFCLSLASAMGLSTALAQLRYVREKPYLLVERYDRLETSFDVSARIHQEDFCQALGLPSSKKYAGEGGPGLRDCFNLVRRVTTRPAANVLRLLDAVIFNVLIGNCDAHGKNFSLLYRGFKTELAPLYDLLSTIQYPDLSDRFAMRVGGEVRLEDIGKRSWTVLAEVTGISEPFIRKRVQELSALAAQQNEAVAEGILRDGGKEEYLAPLTITIAHRTQSLSQRV
ncbi:type II toxin-antitoxin system HipA family toxin [Parvularcula maris]|uniref:Type II toxin-antitoxin system HipA family toxin n=1 Tax=Parvularcula maris TaxID=2965077 RepID=A0A9X2RJ11_9PROT|nr:type II toxin-antitoxin system HipA family toxin [Parvularcula maris]MCQ8185461.1 type II toxin-antitoxin system HipA family toxin [Parvularcula maris]